MIRIKKKKGAEKRDRDLALKLFALAFGFELITLFVNLKIFHDLAPGQIVGLVMILALFNFMGSYLMAMYINARPRHGARRTK